MRIRSIFAKYTYKCNQSFNNVSSPWNFTAPSSKGPSCTFRWQMISVSECSNHCGPGVRTVTWRCVQILLDSPPHSPRPVPAHACLHIEKPSEHQPCVGPCDDAHWSYSEWNACSVSCGGGVQLRSAICVDSNERQVRDENCAKQEKHLKRICSQEACPKWDLGEWSPVSERRNNKGKNIIHRDTHAMLYSSVNLSGKFLSKCVN